MLVMQSWGNQWDYWTYFDGAIDDHVVMFDGPTKTIWILPEISEVLVKEHLYSDWKEWMALLDHTKYERAFETEGGRPTSPTERLGDSYLMINDWVIRQMDASTPTNIIGNLYAYDENGLPKDPYGDDPDGQRSINSTVSNIVNTIIIPVAAPPSLTPEQDWVLQLAYEEAKRSRQMQTNNVSIQTINDGQPTQYDEIVVFDDDGVTELYRIRVNGEDCDNRTVTYEKPYCPITPNPVDPCP